MAKAVYSGCAKYPELILFCVAHVLSRYVGANLLPEAVVWKFFVDALLGMTRTTIASMHTDNQDRFGTLTQGRDHPQRFEAFVLVSK